MGERGLSFEEGDDCSRVIVRPETGLRYRGLPYICITACGTLAVDAARSFLTCLLILREILESIFVS